jgi:hypothetical protein
MLLSTYAERVERAFGTGLREQLAGRETWPGADVRGRAYARYAAALDERLHRISESLELLSRELAEAEERLERRHRPLEPVPREPDPEPARLPERAVAGHLLFVPGPSGYALLPRPGSPPEVGSELELGEPPERYVVSKVAAAPVPGDARRCAYLLS